MIVIGADTHKVNHTCVAAKSGTGELAGELTAKARRAGFEQLLDWGRSLDPDRIWAIEDCRHVSGGFERFLVDSGERVVRVPPKLMGESRRGERSSGKSDPIDAPAIARAALKEDPETLPAAPLDAEAMEIKLLLDHREDLVRSRSEDQNRLRRHLHHLWPEPELPARCLDRIVWLDRIARKLARAEQGARVRVCRELERSIRDRSRRASGLERKLAALVSAKAPELVALPGCGVLSAVKILGETAGVKRFSSDAKLARLAGVAPIPASSGKRVRHRLRSRRQPPAQLRASSHRGHPGPCSFTCTRLSRPQAGRGQVAHRGPSLPQTPPRPRRLAGSSRSPRADLDRLPLHH